MLEVSGSKLRTWRRCHAQYDYAWVQNLERNRPKLQLVRGKLIGECIDAIVYRRIEPKADVHWESVIAKYAKEFGKLFDEEREYYGDIIGEVTNIVRRYERIYADDGLTYYVHNGRSSELEVRVTLATDIVFTGHLDKYPQDAQGRYFVEDHKTHRTFPDEEARFSDLQLVFYFWAAPLSGFPKPTGVMWDYVRTKPPAVPEVLKSGELTRRKNIDTDFETYHAAILANNLKPADYADILNQLKPRGSDDFFKRIWLPSPSKELVKSVVNDAKITAQEIKFLGGVDKTRSMTRDCKQCNYYTLCQAEVRGLDAEFIKKSEYHLRQPNEVRTHGDED